ncbi:NUDIX domain-containing protein [Paenibacillus chitinolyticus]|uniref:NUDIX hydrolase n=1 Tax=Paenibacillus chitinolyticus TaxID=79263 RepID=UPI0036DBCEFD
MRTPIFYGSVHVFLSRNGETLLLKRKNTGFMDGKWSVVAGRIDGGEEVKTAAVREAKEEAGIDIRPEDLEITGIMHRKNTNSEWIDFFLKARRWQGEIGNMEPHKCEELRWFPEEGLPAEMVPYVREALLNRQESLWFESFGWAGVPVQAAP